MYDCYVSGTETNLDVQLQSRRLWTRMESELESDARSISSSCLLSLQNDVDLASSSIKCEETA